jgi:hypothetical protein
MENKNLYTEVQTLMAEVKESEFIYNMEPSDENRKHYYELWIELYNKYSQLKRLQLEEFLEGFTEWSKDNIDQK